MLWSLKLTKGGSRFVPIESNLTTIVESKSGLNSQVREIGRLAWRLE